MQNKLGLGLGDDDQPPHDHNLPPGLPAITAELLTDELAEDKKIAGELLERAGHAKIATLEDAGKVQLLASKLKDHAEDVGNKRSERKAPYLAAGRLIDEHCNAIIKPLSDAYTALRRMLTEFQRRQEREAEEARRRAEAEARRKAGEAAELERKAREAETAGQPSVKDQLAAIEARDAAERARDDAETIRPAPIHTLAGSVGTSRRICWEVTDLPAAIGWLLDRNGAAVIEALDPLIGRELRAIGIAHAERARHPGVRVWIESESTVRRRR